MLTKRKSGWRFLKVLFANVYLTTSNNFFTHEQLLCGHLVVRFFAGGLFAFGFTPLQRSCPQKLTHFERWPPKILIVLLINRTKHYEYYRLAAFLLKTSSLISDLRTYLQMCGARMRCRAPYTPFGYLCYRYLNCCGLDPAGAECVACSVLGLGAGMLITILAFNGTYHPFGEDIRGIWWPARAGGLWAFGACNSANIDVPKIVDPRAVQVARQMEEVPSTPTS